jgi:hypothetical protein
MARALQEGTGIAHGKVAQPQLNRRRVEYGLYKIGSANMDSRVMFDFPI